MSSEKQLRKQAQPDHMRTEERKQEVREFDVDVDSLESQGYDSENNSSNSQSMQQDSEIHMSLCLHAFKALEP